MKQVHETFINDVRLTRDARGSVQMRCVVFCKDSAGVTLHQEEMTFSEAQNHDCRAARVFVKRLHRMVKERIIREQTTMDTSAVKAELVDRCCGK